MESPAIVYGSSKVARAAALGTCLLLLCLAAVLNLWYLLDNCPLDLSGDEAHYWEWSRRLDLSYYSKGPLVAYIIAAGRSLLAEWSQRRLGNEVLAVRLPAIALSFVTGLGIYFLALSTVRRPWLALTALAITAVVPVFAAGAVLMTIDAPLACAWVWALVCLNRALLRDSAVAWIAGGLLIAIGILAKYTMLLILPVLALVILASPELRRLAKRPGPYAATGIGLLGFVPILIWNARNGWVSFRHVAGQAGLAGGLAVNPFGPLEYAAGQFAVTGVVWLVVILWAAVELLREPRCENEPQETTSIRLLILATTIPLLVFLGFSLITKIQPNWPVLALFPGIVLASLWLSRRFSHPSRRTRRQTALIVALGVAIGGAASVLIRNTEWLMPLFAKLARSAPAWELTPVAKYDPSARLRGWRQLGAAVGEVLADERTRGRDPFVLTDEYQVASEIAFYCPGQPTVYCAESILGGRRSQYDLWPNPIRDAESFHGRACIYVGSLHPELKNGGPSGQPPFRNLRQLRVVRHEVAGHPLQIWGIHASDEFVGFDLQRSTQKVKF